MLRKLMTFMVTMAVFILTNADAEVIQIDNTQLQKLIESDVTIIDVRRIEEWNETGVVSNSLPMTFFDQKGQYDAREWIDNLSSVSDKKTPVILICHTGVRSKIIADWLDKSIGYEKIYNVTDGIESWIKSGRSTVPVTLKN